MILDDVDCAEEPQGQPSLGFGDHADGIRIPNSPSLGTRRSHTTALGAIEGRFRLAQTGDQGDRIHWLFHRAIRLSRRLTTITGHPCHCDYMMR